MDGGHDSGGPDPAASGDGTPEGRDPWRRRRGLGSRRAAGERRRGPDSPDAPPPTSPLRPKSWPRRLLDALLAASALAVLGVAVLWLTLPEPAPLEGRWPESTAYIELRQTEARDAGRELDLRWEPVPLSRVPDHVERAVRVAEDAMFYRHPGVDLHELRASLREWWTDEESLRGASTITMQLARNLYLSPERSYWRKLRELLLAFRLEARLSKSRILELYLNVVELGPGVFGVEAAAGHYWGTSVGALGRRQAAELAATLPAPLADNPDTRTRRFLWRADLIHRRAFGAREPDAEIPTPGVEAPDPAGIDTPVPPDTDTLPRGLPAADSVGPGPDTLAPPADSAGAESDTAGTEPDTVATEPDTVAADQSSSAAQSRSMSRAARGSTFGGIRTQISRSAQGESVSRAARSDRWNRRGCIVPWTAPSTGTTTLPAPRSWSVLTTSSSAASTHSGRHVGSRSSSWTTASSSTGAPSRTTTDPGGRGS